MTTARSVRAYSFLGALFAFSAFGAKAHAVCGDGALNTAETCDDGNTTGGDGCSANCQYESGYVCNGAPSLCCFQDAALAYQLLGSASVNSGTGEVTLTPDDGFQAGYAWYKSPISFARDFAIRLQLHLGSKDATGADGGSIIFQRDPRGTSAIGSSGAHLGATGITPLAAVEFDDWNNDASYGDIADDHVSVFVTSPGNAVNHIASAVCMDSACSNFEDGQYHNYYVEWTAATKTMVVEIERNNVAETRVTLVYDFVANVFGGVPDGITFGFAASTGLSSNLQKFCPAAPSGFTVPRDSDGDTHDDAVDDDDDNDGILDVVESEETFGGDDPSADHDADGVPNYFDKSYWDDVLHDSAHCADTLAPIDECDSVPDQIDADHDGLPNHLDADSDNDGTNDVMEAGGVDDDGDGLRDGCAPVAADGSCANGDLVPPDSDGDGVPDTRDLDSDDDGICDGPLAVSGLCTAGPDSTRTDACQPAANNLACTTADSDGDGVLNADECAGGLCTNSDTDLLPDYLDPDSDDDGIPDGVECTVSPCEDTDGTGGPDFRDLDSDGDGYDDEVECTQQPCENTDLTGEADYRDFDSDDDGDPDATDCARLAAGIGSTVAEIVADGIDQDCDGGDRCYDDDDNDGVLDGSGDTRASADLDCLDANEGAAGDPTTDCDDTDPAIHPGAIELVADEVDQNCDGMELCLVDQDGDGYWLGSTPDQTVPSSDVDCDDPGEAGLEDLPGDCDDTNAAIRPGVAEIAGDEIDQDCDGSERCQVDIDGDGYWSATSGTTASFDLDCDDPNEASTSDPGNDCDDTNTAIHPSATEICDLVDQDCDGDLVETFPNLDGDTLPDCADDDEDGDGDPDATDCADDDATVYTGAADNTCNGVDNDCDGEDDEDGPADDAACGAKDADGDGILNAVECEDPDDCADTDDDRNSDFLDLDSDGDGETDADECTEDPCEDADEDGIADYRERSDRDTDGDGLVDSEDADADGDGVEDGEECGGAPCGDADGDGIPDPYDLDDGEDGGDSDGDGVLDSVECGDWPCVDSDGDLVPDYADTDSDDDGVADGEDSAPADPCLPDADAPACANGDADGDGETNAEDAAPRDPCVPSRDALACPGGDTDGDGEINEDDDEAEDPCVPSELALACDRGDTDRDGIDNGEDRAPVDPCDPNRDALECGRGDADGDGVSNAFECSARERCPDLDGDGKPDWLDDDDDGDGVATSRECPDPRACLDTDGDGIDDYRDSDDDGDGKSTRSECSDAESCEDSDGDGRPDYIDGHDDRADEDADSDDDGRPDADECGDAEVCPDTDGDGDDDAHDRDDDDDGRLTARELADEENYGEDVDGDGIPNHLDQDSDGDGVPDAYEGEDDNDNGVPDYLEANTVNLRGGGGLACSTQTGAGSSGGASLLMLATSLWWMRRRRRG